jgi:hypothetical protein
MLFVLLIVGFGVPTGANSSEHVASAVQHCSNSDTPADRDFFPILAIRGGAAENLFLYKTVSSVARPYQYLRYCDSTDFGLTWTGTGGRGSLNGPVANLTVASDYPGTHLTEAWEQFNAATRAERIVLAYWGNFAPAWDDNITVPSIAFSRSLTPFLSMAFQKGRPGGESVFFSHAEDYVNNAYQNWSAPFRVAGAGGPTGPAPSTMASIAIDTLDRIHFAYLRSDLTGRRDVYYLRNDDRGHDDAWAPEPGIRLSSTTADNHDLVIVLSRQGQAVVAVWTATQAGGDEDLAYAYSLDGGDTWRVGRTLTATAYHEGYPAIAVDPLTSTFHVAYWRDDSAPGYDSNILYTQASAGDPGNWTNPQSVVDAGAVVSDTYRRPAIVSYWRGGTDNVVSVAWTDVRNATPREDLYMTDVDLLDCSATGNPMSGVAPLSVSFDASANGGLPPYAYVWRFGDGATGAGATQSHTYVPPGQYVASVQVTDMAGNVCFDSIAIEALSPLPDLVVRSADISPSPPAYIEGRPLWANATVRNLGGGNATDVTVRLALGSPTGPSLGDTTVPAIPSLGNVSVSFPWTPPFAGTYMVCVVADPDGGISESNEGNNVGCASLDVLTRPDLVFLPGDVVAAPTAVPFSGTANVTAVLRNLGGSSAANALVTFFRDANGNGFPDAAEAYDTQTVPSLPGGTTTSLASAWTADAVGPQSLCAYADPVNAIPEANESNNVACAAVTVLVGPDYVAWDPEPSSPVLIGLARPVILSLSLRNAGDTSTNVTTRVVFFNASTPSSPFAWFDVPPLAANETVGPFAASWLSPAIPGFYAVNTIVDARDDIAESNESNNRDTWTVHVVSGPITTLLVGQPNVTAAETHVTSSTALSFAVLDPSGTGIGNTMYRVDGGPWVNYTATGPFALAGEGAHLVEWFSTDFAGNRESVADAILRVDDTPPATALAVGDPKSLVGETFVNASTPITLLASDGGATPVGVASTFVRVWGGTWSAWSDYTSPFIFTGADGVRYLEYRSTDLLGNQEGVRNETLVLDDTPPTTTLSPATGPYTRATTFILSATDPGSGVDRTEVRVDAGAWAPYTGSFTLAAGDHTVSYRSVDRLGNREPERIQAVRIEAPPPVTANLKPLVAVVFATIMALVGVWSARRAPWPTGSRRQWRAFLLAVVPFVVAEGATGVVSHITGILTIPPVLGAGTAVDVGILVAGLAVAVNRVRAAKPPS